jgi:glycosyltransferase involved in cell wall biosynthesis
MRVLLVTAFYAPAWGMGGIARATASLARELAHLGHDVLVATTRWDASAPLEELSPHLRVRRFESPRWLRQRLFPWPHGLARFLRDEARALDIAHLAGHRTGLELVAWRALRQAQVPFILQPHGTYPHHGARQTSKRVVDRLFGDAVLRDAAALIAVSRAEAADLPRAAQVIPNGVDDVGFAEKTARAGGREILFVGTDAPQKRGHTLPALLRALPEARLVIVGRCGAAFRQLFGGFGERVSFRDVLAGDALAAAYAHADLLVQPAVGEAFGLAPFEAALHGTDAVVADGHGCGEWFGRAGGCVVPADDVDALVGAVRGRLGDMQMASREAAAVAAFARRELAWSRVAREVEAAHRGAMLGHGKTDAAPS